MAEQDAVRWLEGQGYRIVERNFRHRAGEMDVVAWDGDTLCFVEVRSRTQPGFGPAVATVDRAKQRKLIRAASLYLARRRLEDTPCRFDVLGLDMSPEGRWTYSLIKHAFTA